MKNIWKRVLSIAAVCACLIGPVAWADSQTNSEAEAVKEAFLGSQNTMYQIGRFESPNGKTDTLTEADIQQYIDEFNADMDRYYASGNQCRQMYKETNEQLLRDVSRNDVYYLVDGGVLDCTFQNIDIHEDGKTATVKAVCQAWGNWVEENEAGKLEVTAPVGQDKMTVTMVKEDGMWKLQKIDEMSTEFGADAICELEEKAGTKSASVYSEDQMNAIEKYQEKTNLAEYETFDEALAVAKNLHADEMSSFALWLNRET